MSIALVGPKTTAGGLKTVAGKIQHGLQLEGFDVASFQVGGVGRLPQALYDDLRLIRILPRFESLLYWGSLAFASHLIVKGPRKGLFIHGFARQEQLKAIINGDIWLKPADAFALAYGQAFNLSPIFSNLDYYAGHSESVREANGIKGPYAKLPQFVFKDEVESASRSLQLPGVERGGTKDLLITTYLRVDSPRLLTPDQLELLATLLKKRYGTNLRFVVIDPRARLAGSATLEATGLLSKEKFLQLVTSSDVYLENCLDEELGFGSIEAALHRVPVAKVTRQRCKSRCDYGSHEIISAPSIDALVSALVGLFQGSRGELHEYGERAREFVSQRRSWDAVKGNLMNAIHA